MSINKDDLLNYVITPTLQLLNLDSEAARQLLLGTCAQESAMGTYLHQINGIALGIFQMEEFTHDDCWSNYLNNHPELTVKIKQLSARCISTDLIYNLRYATAMARIKYLRAPEQLPLSTDIVGLARYWKNYYNSPAGKGTTAEFIVNYKKYVQS